MQQTYNFKAMEGFKERVSTNYAPISYDDIAEQIKMLPNEYLGDVSNYISFLLYCNREKEDKKIQNLRAAIREGEKSGFHKDFDPEAFLQRIKSERYNG